MLRTNRFLLTLVLVGVPLPLGALDDPVRIQQGLLEGAAAAAAGGVRTYKGIPYAAPPVGELRSKAPQTAQA